MGLDNIPREYPCRKQGTAVLVNYHDKDGNPIIDPDTGEPEKRIDCKQTQNAGGCPWLNELNKQDESIRGGRVYGMFGTDCWYRGKHGNYLIAQITDEDPMGDGYSFYGDEEDGTIKTVNDCIGTADFIGVILDDARDGGTGLTDTDGDDLVPQLRYAEWYLRWAAEHCGGLFAWY